MLCYVNFLFSHNLLLLNMRLFVIRRLREIIGENHEKFRERILHSHLHYANECRNINIITELHGRSKLFQPIR